MHFNRCICPIITTRWKLFCATSLIGKSKGDDAGLILVQSPDASSFILLSNPTAFLGGGRCLINSHKLAENEIVTEACVWPSSQVNTLVIRHKTPHPRMHVYNCNVDQVSMGPESKPMWQWRALWLKEPEGRVTISFPLKRAGASEHSDKVQAAANESKPTGEITPTESRNLRLQKDYSNCTQEPKKKKKKNLLRIKKPFRVGQGTFRTPLGRVASLSHSGVQTTDALRNAQESSHPVSPTQAICTGWPVCLELSPLSSSGEGSPRAQADSLRLMQLSLCSEAQSRVFTATHSLVHPLAVAGRVVPPLGQALPLPLPP